jgi:hypothetical protein
MRQWKLSPMDLESITRWDAYSEAKDRMMAATDVPGARWTIIESDDKRRSRLNAINHILATVPWSPVEHDAVVIPARPASKYERASLAHRQYAADYAATLR